MPWYINRTDKYGNDETASEAQTEAEAREQLGEFSFADPHGTYTISTEAKPGWEEREGDD